MTWDDLSTPFLDTPMGESIERIVYRPYGELPREIKAKVFREPPRPIEGMPGRITDVILVMVENSDDDGISSAHIDVGKDRIDVSPRIGVARSTRHIHQLVAHDESMMTIEVRA